MAANTNPIYSRTPDVQWNTTDVTAANTTKDLTSGTSYLVWTADATEGGYLEKLAIRPLGTNVATVMRVWLNNGLTTGTRANNTLIHEVSIVATTVSETAAQAAFEVALNQAIPAGYKVYVTIGTAVAAGFHVTAFGGKY